MYFCVYTLCSCVARGTNNRQSRNDPDEDESSSSSGGATSQQHRIWIAVCVWFMCFVWVYIFTHIYVHIIHHKVRYARPMCAYNVTYGVVWFFIVIHKLNIHTNTLPQYTLCTVHNIFARAFVCLSWCHKMLLMFAMGELEFASIMWAYTWVFMRQLCCCGPSLAQRCASRVPHRFEQRYLREGHRHATWIQISGTYGLCLALRKVVYFVASTSFIVFWVCNMKWGINVEWVEFDEWLHI